MLVTIAQLFLSLSILIGLHEGGHYLAARMTGTRVNKFYLFFDFLFPFPDMVKFALFKKKVGDTEYGLGWFPMGGYVAIAGMDDETQEKPDRPPLPDEYGAKSRPQKLLIMLGGVIVNFLLGFLIFALSLWWWGEEKLPNSEISQGIYVDELGEEMGLRDGDQIVSIGDAPFDYFSPGIVKRDLGIGDAKTITVRRGGQTVIIHPPDSTITKLMAYENKGAEVFGPRVPYIFGELSPGFPAEKAGFQPGDSIVMLDGRATPFKHQFLKGMRCRANETLRVGFYRQGVDSMMVLPLTLDENGKMGVAHQPMTRFFELEKINYSLIEAFPAGLGMGMDFINTQLRAFKQMFKGKIKAQDSLGGFGSIGGLFGTTWDWHRFWQITGMLSLILAIMNLLPIPMLDGGYVLFLLVEMITRREIPERIMNALMNVGLFLVLGLMVFANGMDIIRALFGGGGGGC